MNDILGWLVVMLLAGNLLALFGLLRLMAHVRDELNSEAHFGPRERWPQQLREVEPPTT